MWIHSINKVNFALFTVVPFSSKYIMIDPFMTQNTVSMTLFTDYCTCNIFFTRELVWFSFIAYQPLLVI